MTSTQDLIKTCPKCGETKSADEFYTLGSGKLDGRCAECKREDIRLYRTTERGKKAMREQARRARAKDPQREKTIQRTHKLIYSGKIKRQPCSVCGSELVEAHHPDYSDPTNVVWFCQKHHTEHHMAIRKDKIAVNQ